MTRKLKANRLFTQDQKSHENVFCKQQKTEDPLQEPLSLQL